MLTTHSVAYVHVTNAKQVDTYLPKVQPAGQKVYSSMKKMT